MISCAPKTTRPAKPGWRLLLALGCGLLWAGAAFAQPAPPPKEYRLHRVRRLRPAPLPPGGLVPVRDTAAGTWGLADTLGHVVVRPAFERPVYLQQDTFVQVRYWNLEKAESWRTRTDRWHLRTREKTLWLNARGQYLLTNKRRKAYQRPDGSLHLKAWRRRFIEPEYQYQVEHDNEPDERKRRNQWYWSHHNRLYLGDGLAVQAQPHVFWYYLHTVRGQHAPGPPPEALFTLRGRRLTPYYGGIYPGQEGRLRFRTTDTRHYGYLNRRGQVVIPARFGSAGSFRYGRATVGVWDAQNGFRYGLIDTLGAYVWPPQPPQLDGPDEAGLVRRITELGKGRQQSEYLRLDGQPAFPGQYFRYAAPFTDSVAQVTDSTGQEFLLDRRGRRRPLPAPPPRTLVAKPQVEGNGPFRLLTAEGHRLTPTEYAWAEPLLGGWFATRRTPDAPIVLITPQGQSFPLPAGYVPDEYYHGRQLVPFEDGLLKVCWGKPIPYIKGNQPRYEAFMTRSGRLLISPPKAN